MTSIAMRSPVLKPVLPLGTPKPAPPHPGAHDAFRITQRFDTPDAFYRDGRRHGAVDLGIYRCGDPVVAMAPGRARRVKDNARAMGAKTDGLGIIIDHGHGVETWYWHLNGYSVADGATVKAGQQVGILGSTGLGDVCHLHIELRVNRVQRDPEPHIFGATLVLGAARGGEDMRFGGSAFSHMALRAAAKQGARFRSDATLTADVIRQLPGGAALVIDKAVRGQSGPSVAEHDASVVPYGQETWYVAWLWVDGQGYRVGVLHASTVSNVRRIVEASSLQTKLERAQTSIDGALQASEASSAAIRTARDTLK